MPKFVIETVRVIRTKYYAEVDNPEWACDGIVMEELDHFSDVFYCENITTITPVEEYPVAQKDEGVNGGVNIFNYEKHGWDKGVRFDLDPRHQLKGVK